MRSPLRVARRAARTLRDRFAPGAVVLLYHRIAALDFDPQKLAVSPENFAAHLDVLAKISTPVMLTDLRAAIARRGSPRGLTAVTFDDGYADNLLQGKPALEQRGVPATVFVASGYCSDPREFWWDELERIFLRPGTLPPAITMSFNGRSFTRDVVPADYDEHAFQSHRRWTVESTDDPTPRHTLYRELHRLLLRPGNTERREEAMAAIRRWANSPSEPRATHRPLTPAEVRELQSETLCVGAHTVTHPRLSELDRRSQEGEIAGSRRELESFTGTPVTTFAYPYGAEGDYDADSVAIARSSFDLACANYRGTVHADTSPFELPRFLVRDWTADEFRARIAPFLS